MPNEDKYITKESLNYKLNERDSKIYQRIDEVEKDARNNFYDLKMEIIESNSTQKNMYKELKVMNKNAEKTNTFLEGLTPRMTDLEYKIKQHSSDIQSVTDTVKEKKSGNTQVIVALITFAGVVAVPLIPILGDMFFK